MGLFVIKDFCFCCLVIEFLIGKLYDVIVNFFLWVCLKYFNIFKDFLYVFLRNDILMVFFFNFRNYRNYYELVLFI